MTDSEKLDSLLTDVAYLVKFVEGLRMGGPRILPGDGSKPHEPDKPTPHEPEPPVPTDPDVSDEFKALVAQRNPQLDLGGLFFHLGHGLSPPEIAYARAHNVPGFPDAPQPDQPQPQVPAWDPRTRRDLTGLRGNPLVVEGGAGSAVVLQLNEPAGQKLEIEIFRINSNWGSCSDAEIFCQGLSARGTGSDAQAKLIITTTGNDPVRVVLHQAGAVGVQVNPSA